MKKVVVIGGGPAGLSAALYLARAGLEPLVIAGDPPGGQLMLTSEVENFPGHRSIHGQELVANIREQAAGFGAFLLDSNVTGIESESSNLIVKTTVENFKTKSVLIATGAHAIWLGLESETRLRGRGVSACATCDGFFFRNKIVAVIGGGDSALEEALFLTKFASEVVIVHRRDSFRASKIMQKRVMDHKNIRVVWNAEVLGVLGKDKVSGLRLSILGKESDIELEGVFVAIGHKPDTDFVKDLVFTDYKGYILTQNQLAEKLYKGETDDIKNHLSVIENMKKIKYFAHATSIQGIFAAGDCVDKVYRQASTAAGMGVAASLDIERYLEILSG